MKRLAAILLALATLVIAAPAFAVTLDQTATVGTLSCKVGYTIPASGSTALHYYYVYQTGYYDEGTYVNPRDVHRVQKFYYHITDGGGNPMAVGNTYGYNYFINHVWDEAHSGSHAANTVNGSFAPAMTSSFYHSSKTVLAPTGYTYRANRVQFTLTVVISHVDISVVAANRVAGLSDQFGKCVMSQESPWWDGTNP